MLRIFLKFLKNRVFYVNRTRPDREKWFSDSKLAWKISPGTCAHCPETFWSQNFVDLCNDLHIYVFATGVACEVTHVGSTVTCTISFSDKETWMLRWKIWMLKFLGANKHLTQNNPFLNKEKIYFKAVNNQEGYFRGHENICFTVFPNNMLTSYFVFNVPLDLIDDH